MTGGMHGRSRSDRTAWLKPHERSSCSTAEGTARAGRSFARCRPGRLWLAAAMLCCAALSLAACAGGETKAAVGPSSSDNIVLAADGRTVYAVNADVGTVTKADVRSGKVLQETAVGRFPQQAALSPDGRELYVTCRDTDKIDILKTKDLSLAGTIDAGGIEPYGIVVSPDGKRLYVSNDRSGTVTVIDRAARKAESTVAVGERPRALALTADGTKLYVGLYLKAAIAVIDTTSPAVKSTIELSASPDVSDPKKSQGIPNTLEQIRIAPDGKSAWATHLLTNTDSVIAFDETVFPAVSVIDTEADRELPKQRKELFKAINVPDSLGKTTIVSNPSDIAFAPDGAKAYVLMSGSEDVVAFDLNRGGNASGIVRHVPGDWPVGMALTGDGGALYVNNGNTHDLATIRTAGDARAEAKTLKLIAKDPMSKEERLGKTVFMSANSDEYPVTQQHWMSCASCHSAGETDGLTLMASKGPRNVPSNVGAMETGLLLWDGSRDDLTDYIHTVQDEMGGMLAQDAGKPMDAELQKLFDALSVYMKDPDSMPVPRSPYRAADGELTPEARAGKALFETKGQCIACHAGPYFTDSAQATGGTGKLTTADTTHLYDVGTANPLDKPSKGDARAGYADPRTPKQWDVPTLRGVWATAPYLHDGSAATLKDVLTTRNPEGKHGGALTDDEIDKVVAYLQQIQ
ncbi:beta-propeller fold lactonase family protein [Cohnella sp. 56]|uniref:beta-propeller fold lactonase family protein n=2 Tax=Cohnella sp. 56 TaxID=3113722 RepID=UPI0030E80D9D